MNVTMVIGTIDTETKTLTHANAGHYVLEDAPEVIPNIQRFLSVD